jgi:hypothetical protein
MERGSRKRSPSARREKMERVGDRKEKMEGHCSTGQSPQWAVVPVEEEEEEEEEKKKKKKMMMMMMICMHCFEYGSYRSGSAVQTITDGECLEIWKEEIMSRLLRGVKGRM